MHTYRHGFCWYPPHAGSSISSLHAASPITRGRCAWVPRAWPQSFSLLTRSISKLLPLQALKSKHLRSLCLSMASVLPLWWLVLDRSFPSSCRSKPEKQPPEAGVCVSASVHMAADWFCRRAALYLQTPKSKHPRSVCLGAWGMATHSWTKAEPELNQSWTRENHATKSWTKAGPQLNRSWTKEKQPQNAEPKLRQSWTKDEPKPIENQATQSWTKAEPKLNQRKPGHTKLNQSWIEAEPKLNQGWARENLATTSWTTAEPKLNKTGN